MYFNAYKYNFVFTVLLYVHFFWMLIKIKMNKNEKLMYEMRGPGELPSIPIFREDHLKNDFDVCLNVIQIWCK